MSAAMSAATSAATPDSEAEYEWCLNWIKKQSAQFRSRLLKDLSEWERQLQSEIDSSEILTGEIFRTDWGEVTEYMMPESGKFTFRAPDGKPHSHTGGAQFYDKAMPGRGTSWYFVACKLCNKCAVTFPDNGGSWPMALRQLGWQASKKWANAYCPACSRR